jgi:hypothetical protein
MPQNAVTPAHALPTPTGNDAPRKAISRIEKKMYAMGAREPSAPR